MKKLMSCLSSFRKEERGTIAVETMLIIPALFWAYLAMFAIFDAYRQYGLNQKAAFVIGDMISRETTPLDNSYIDGAQDMMAFLVGAEDDSDVAIRVSSIVFNEDNNSFELDWSVKRGWVDGLADGETDNWHDRLPVMTNNDRVTLVETWVKYDPPFNTGLSDRIVRNFVFTKPRYAPQVLYNP